MEKIEVRKSGKYLEVSRNILEYREQIGGSVYVLLCLLMHPDYNDLLVANELDMNLEEVIRAIAKLRRAGFIKYEKRFHGIIPRDVSLDLRNTIFERDGYCCSKCGAVSELEIDHIMPVSKGGGNEESNLQTLCKTCNRRKSSRMDG